MPTPALEWLRAGGRLGPSWSIDGREDAIWLAEDQICTWCGGICRELVRPHQEYTKVALFKLTGLLLPNAEQWRVLRCEECGHLEWFVVP